MKQTQKEHEWEMEELKLTQSFALKMASLICWSVVSTVFGLGIFFGDKSPLTLGAIAFISLILGIITFTRTRAALI